MKRFFSVQIPSLVGIMLLLVGVGVTSYLVDQGIIFEGRAAPDKTPTNIAITNVSPTGFTVLYTTDEAVAGSLTYGTRPEDTNIALDDRDQQTGRPSPSSVHHITVRNLTPNTMYYFSILSGDTTFKNGAEPYTVKTAPAGSPDTGDTPLTGTVKFPSDGGQVALVLLSPPGTQQRSTLVRADGAYTIPLTNLLTQDLSAPATLRSDSVLEVRVFTHTTSSRAMVLLRNTQPVPIITLGESYDFTISNAPLVTTPASGSAQTFPQTQTGATQQTISIISPQNQETFSDLQPKFSGTALPGEDVTITIQSENPITVTIKADTTGKWEYRPTAPLGSGGHTLTLKTRDAAGTLRELSNSFIVNAQGSSFTEPSISPTRTPTPTITAETPTATPTLPVATVTATATPTSIVTASPSAIPTVTTVLTPSPTRAPMDATGSTEILIGGILGVGTIIIGLMLFLLSRGSLL